MSARERQFEVREVYGSTSTPVGSEWLNIKFVPNDGGTGKPVFIVKKDEITSPPSE